MSNSPASPEDIARIEAQYGTKVKDSYVTFGVRQFFLEDGREVSETR